MKLKFVNINEAPIDEVNLLEEETFQYKKTLSKIDSEFLLKFEGLSMINQNYQDAIEIKQVKSPFFIE